MNQIPKMVTALKEHADVLGLIEYGSARERDEAIIGDYDLVVVLKKVEPEVESLHFSVGKVPVDLNLRSVEEIDALSTAVGFDAVLLDGRVTHDPSGAIAAALDRLRDRQARAPGGPASPDIPGMRHGAQHILDKIRGRWDSNPTLCRYLLHMGVFWFVPQYFEVRGLPYRGEKDAFRHLERHEPGIFAALTRFFAATDDEEKTRLYRSLAEAVLAPVGGLWPSDGVLVFGNQERGEGVFSRLFPGDRKAAQS